MYRQPLNKMTTIHSIVKKFQQFPFNKFEGILILGVDEKASSCYVHFSNKSMLLDALLRVFKKNPELMAVCSDAVKLASTPKKEKVLSPKLQAYLDKILKDIDDLDEKNN